MLKKLFMTVLGFSLCAGMSAASVAPTGPTQQIQGTIDGVLEILKDKGLEQTARRERLSSLLRKRFDFEAMSQRTLGINWKKATLKEQERFVQLFSDLLEATYIGRIEAYSDERVEYLKEKVEDGRAEVDTAIMTKSAEIPFRYKMIQRSQEWLVYDVVVEEVSLIRNYRSSYQEIVKKQGFSGLLMRMQEKLEELRNSKNGGQNQ